MATERLSMRQIREILRQKWSLGRTHRRWPVGIDPLANQEQIIDGKGRVLPPGPV